MLHSSRACISLSLLVAAPAAQTPPLLLHLRLDETTGTTTNDAGPFGNHGTLANFATSGWVTGQVGNALKFDGVDDYVQVGINGGLPVYDAKGTPFTVAFWVKAPAQADRRVYSEQAAAPTNGGPLFTLGSGSTDTTKLRLYVRADDQTVVVSAFSAATVFDDAWHHVVYTDASGVGRIYVDGALDKTVDYSRFNSGPNSSVRGAFTINSVTLGAVVRNNAVATPLNGTIDDLRVWRCSLSLSEIAAVKAGGPATNCGMSIGTYGYGCGPGPLDIVATGSATFGQIVWLQLIRGTPGAAAAFCIGSGVLQPFDLSPVGLPGCTLYQLNMSCFGAGTLLPAGSSAPLPIPVPNDQGLSCLLLDFQGATFSTAVEMSPAVLAMIGR